MITLHRLLRVVVKRFGAVRLPAAFVWLMAELRFLIDCVQRRYVSQMPRWVRFSAYMALGTALWSLAAVPVLAQDTAVPFSGVPLVGGGLGSCAQAYLTQSLLNGYGDEAISLIFVGARGTYLIFLIYAFVEVWSNIRQGQDWQSPLVKGVVATPIIVIVFNILTQIITGVC